LLRFAPRTEATALSELQLRHAKDPELLRALAEHYAERTWVLEGRRAILADAGNDEDLDDLAALGVQTPFG
jgi:molybdopterin converting factor small subunit